MCRGGKDARAQGAELTDALRMPEPSEFEITRDPFAPLSGSFYRSKTNGGAGELTLCGILYKEDSPLLLMETPDGVGVFKKGDTISEYKVKKIEPKKAILAKGDKEFIFELGDENEK